MPCDLDAAIAWLREHAVIKPLVIGDLFDSSVISWQKDLLLLIDDLSIRQVAAELDFRKTTWTRGVMLTARDR
jgi:hypothetical protein